MQGEKVDPDDDQSSKDQSSDQTGRGSSDAVLSGSRSSEFRKSHSKSQHAKTSRRLCISRQDHAANRLTSCEHARPARRPHSEDGTVQDHEEHRAEKESDQPGEDESSAMQSQVHSIQALQEPWKSNTSGRCPCRYATTEANDAKGTEYQSGELLKDFSGAVHRRDCQRSQ